MLEEEEEEKAEADEEEEARRGGKEDLVPFGGGISAEGVPLKHGKER